MEDKITNAEAMDQLVIKAMRDNSNKDLFKGETIPASFLLDRAMGEIMVKTFNPDADLNGVTRYTLEYAGDKTFLIAMNDNNYCLWSKTLPRETQSCLRSENPEESFKEIRDQLQTYDSIRKGYYIVSILLFTGLVAIAVGVMYCLKKYGG